MEPYAAFPSALPVSPAGVLPLALRPAAAVYQATAVWEAYANGDYHRSTIRKQVVLQVRAAGRPGYELDFRTNPPVLTTAQDLQPLEQVAVRLAALYERLVVQAAPSGEFVALLNHEALLHTWAGMAQALRAATTDDDDVTNTLLAFMDAQLQHPDRVLLSLQHDYLYQTLLPNFYNQPLASRDAPARSRRFTSFFDQVPLWFWEHVRVQPAETPEQLTVRLQGTLDAQKTDTAAVQALMVKALELAPSPAGAPPLPTPLPAPHFAYEATYVLAQPTGLPLSVDLTVYARLNEVYNKQYSLTITRQ